jgi:hypothetical protein
MQDNTIESKNYLRCLFGMASHYLSASCGPRCSADSITTDVPQEVDLESKIDKVQSARAELSLLPPAQKAGRRIYPYY